MTIEGKPKKPPMDVGTQIWLALFCAIVGIPLAIQLVVFLAGGHYP
jgi:hypothetical protein